MDRFSDKYTRLESSEYKELVSYISSYAHLFYESNYELVLLPSGNPGVRTRVSVNAGSDSLLIQHEPVVIEIVGSDVESALINVYPDRENFPFDYFPHINYAVNNLPPSLCLTRESFDNWYAEHSFGELIALIEQWFNDALRGNLIKTDKGDFFEPFRVDNAENHLFKIPVEDSYLEAYTHSGCICYTVDSLGDNLFSRFCIYAKPKNKDIGVLLFRSGDKICRTWFVERPRTLKDLYQFINDNEFVLDDNQINRYIEEHGKDVEHIFLQFSFIRPVTVLGKDSRVDYLTFCVNLTDYMSNNMDGRISSVQMIDLASTKLANYISNTDSAISDKNILILGCGAIGSKLVYHLYRDGICNLTICDNDYFNSHNVCRHAIVKHGLFDKKVKLVKAELDNMFRGNDKLISVVDEDILKWLPNADLTKYDMIIDATASASVFRLLDRMSTEITCSIIHFALSDAGNIGHVYVNVCHDATLSDYYMEIARESINNEDLSKWLKNESKYNLDRVRIGEGCHSNTMRLADEIISTHTGIAASVVKSVLRNRTENQAYLSFVNVEYEGQVFTDNIKIPVYVDICCSNDVDWHVRIPSPLLKKIQLEAKLAGKKEIGGYLMGNVDTKHKVIYVLHQFKPADSKQKTDKLQLGLKGWREEYQKVSKCSAKMIDYIGDWHSHPSGPLDMSVTDIITNYIIKTDEIQSEYGVCIITNNHETQAYVLVPGIKIYLITDKEIN